MVGIHHPVLGFEPVAVLNTLKVRSPRDIMEHVRITLGDSYAIGDVLSLEQIGLQEFPLNPTHKIQKTKIRERVMERMGWVENKETGCNRQLI